MTETGDIALRSAVGTVTRATVGNIPRFNSHFSVIRNRFVSMRMKPLIRLSFRDLQLFLCCHIHICNILASGFVFFFNVWSGLVFFLMVRSGSHLYIEIYNASKIDVFLSYNKYRSSYRQELISQLYYWSRRMILIAFYHIKLSEQNSKVSGRHFWDKDLKVIQWILEIYFLDWN